MDKAIELNQYRGYYNNINSKIFLKIITYIQIILIIILNKYNK